MDDEEYKLYIESKSRSELVDILYHIDCTEHPNRVEYIKSRMASLPEINNNENTKQKSFFYNSKIYRLLDNFLMRLILYVLFIFFPFWVCVFGRLCGLDSVGAMVPLTFAISSISLPTIFFKWSKLITNPKLKLTFKIISIIFGLILAYIHVLSYFIFAPLFKVDNFYWM